MHAIACVSQKGGVGKTTLARLIARTFAAGEWRVKIADFNLKQLSSTVWAARRAEQNILPEIAAEATKVAKAVLRDPNFDLIVFDGRPDSHEATLEIAQASDLVVVPTGPTIDDMEPQIRLAHELRSKAVDSSRIVFVLNRALDSGVAVNDARAFITGAGYRVLDSFLQHRTGYEIAQNSGRAVNETTFQSLNDRADAVAQELVDLFEKVKR